jgi:glutamate-1-semialdehyde 2,1-aminomutase
MNNKELFEESLKYVPGGVHSPVRSFKGLHTTPRFIHEGNGAYIKDEEGKDYIDFCMSFGPLILGHQNPLVKEKLHEALERGWSFGACEKYSLELAEFLINKIDHIEQIRFVNSGTEAVMTAVRLARGFTGKSKIIKFSGCYHGHLDSMLIKAGSGLAGEAESSSSGVTQQMAADTLICELGDQETIKEIFATHNDIAAIIVEPLPANNGLLIQDNEFLTFLRDITKKNDSMLIFDEVISGFRIAFGGMAEKTGIVPDLVTYGKIIGGGLPVGAIAGPQKVMSELAPIGGVYQAGTLSANPLAMTAGLATLQQLTDQFYKDLNLQTDKIVTLFNKWFQESEFSDYQMFHNESLFWQVPTNQALKTVQDIPSNLQERFHGLFEVLLNKGIYLSPNAYEIGFCSLAHDDKVIKDIEQRLWN